MRELAKTITTTKQKHKTNNHAYKRNNLPNKKAIFFNNGLAFPQTLWQHYEGKNKQTKEHFSNTTFSPFPFLFHFKMVFWLLN